MTTQDMPQPEYPFPQPAPSPTAPTSTPPPVGRSWESMYQAERKKARILGATTVAASLLAVGLGAWGVSNEGAAAAGGPGQFGGGQGATSQMAPPGSTGTMPGQGGPMGQDLGSILLNSDGSVNTEAVQQFVTRMPSGALDQILAMAVQNGELTQDQADAITAAAGSSTSSTDSTGVQDT